jgi:hypothetical protein
LCHDYERPRMVRREREQLTRDLLKTKVRDDGKAS